MWTLTYLGGGAHILPNACAVCYGGQFKDKIWNSLVSQARYQVTNQGRLLFEFDSNCIKVNNLFDTSKSVRTPISLHAMAAGSVRRSLMLPLPWENGTTRYDTQTYISVLSVDMPEQ